MSSGLVVAHTQVNGSGSTRPDAQPRELEDYEKIIRIHDEVLAGTHPRLKIPAELVHKHPPLSVHSTVSALPRPAAAGVGAQPVITSHFSTSGEKNNQLKERITGQQTPSESKTTSSRIDPVLLTKSDDLVKAELRLKRDRIEQALREQADRKRAELRPKALGHDAAPEFDVSELLAKALENLKPVPPTEVESRVNNTDSWDGNSLYSSRHNDTPTGSGKTVFEDQSQQAHRVDAKDQVSRLETGSARLDAIVSERALSDQVHDGRLSSVGQENRPPANHLMRQATADTVRVTKAGPAGNEFQLREEKPYEGRGRLPAATSNMTFNLNGVAEDARHVRGEDYPPDVSIQEPRDWSSSNGPAQTVSQQSVLISRSTPEVPVIRSHIRTPIAPQPARVSPLAVARLPAAGLDVRNSGDATSRPFSSRNSPGSPNQAPHPLHPPKRRRVAETNERLDRTSQRAGAHSPETYIKPEPTSPSFSISEDQPPQGSSRADFDGLPQRGNVPARYPNTPPRAERHEPETPSTARMSSAFPRDSYVRPNMERADLHHYSSTQFARHPHSPGPYSVYSSLGSRPTRAISQTLYERPVGEVIHYYRDDPGTYRSRYIRSDRSRSPPPLQEVFSPAHRRPIIMGPPSQTPISRVPLDENYRTYVVEGPPTTVVRQSAIPVGDSTMLAVARPRGTESYYEPIHVAARVSDGSYASHSYVAPSRSSPPVPPRLIVNHPDENGFRGYRQREYSARPAEVIVPREPYLYSRERGPREQYQEVVMPRNYVQRVPSVRPNEVPYQLSPQEEHGSRMSSGYPENINRGYVPPGRYEPLTPSVRDYSVRPEDNRRGYIPVQYVPEPAGRRYVDEIRYIERPREASQAMPGETFRRASYRY